MRAGAPPADDERKVATVLFADLSGSTALADREDPERVRARLERFSEAMQGRSRSPAVRPRSSPATR